MDVRDRSTHIPSLESTGVEAASRISAEGQSSSSTHAALAQDSSTLSSAALAVSQTLQLPQVREERVSALQQQIASGNYSVAHQDVADAMLRTLRG